MKGLIIIALILLLVSIELVFPLHHNHILKTVTDERGLTSVVFTDGKDTVGLDFLTPHELDSLKQTLK